MKQCYTAAKNAALTLPIKISLYGNKSDDTMYSA